MTHKRSAAAHKKKKGGLLIGMRSGVKKAAKGVGEPTGIASKRIWNIVTVLLIAVAAAFLLRRFGVLHF
jgi:hypothetical protein